jgi:hypothetical protein
VIAQLVLSFAEIRERRRYLRRASFLRECIEQCARFSSFSDREIACCKIFVHSDIVGEPPKKLFENENCTLGCATCEEASAEYEAARIRPRMELLERLGARIGNGYVL